VNSEELEKSLRTEFETYLNDALTGMRDQLSELQQKIEAEFDKQRSALTEVFSAAHIQINAERPLDPGFTESVVEHLRLARDEGARIAVEAMSEAEAMEREAAPVEEIPQLPTESFSDLRQAINDISSQQSQAEILKSLVHHASTFTPRGAFFIIKNEHFVGWRTFGSGAENSDEAVREVFLPFTAHTVLAESVRSLVAVESTAGTYGDDSVFLEKLDFGSPEKMYALPLVARGRGVAVLYADGGAEDGPVNLDALETLVRVAGLTVEVSASAKTVKPKRADDAAVESAPAYQAPVSAPSFEAAYQAPVAGYTAPANDFHANPAETGHSFSHDSYAQPSAEPAEPQSPAYDTSRSESWQEDSEVGSNEYAQSPVVEEPAHSTQEFSYESVNEQPAPQADYQFETTQSFDAYQPAQTESFAREESRFSTFEPSPAIVEPEPAVQHVPEPAPAPAQQQQPAARSRFSDRNVDLPIEVSEDERRLHNDARRFARLLVSEIKLYNEQKVREGRDSNDLYERLREAIDRSREMYDKRVQPPVAAKFDYFHYELVNTLGEGSEAKLGGSYPGAAV
jgi:hypothetical protein